MQVSLSARTEQPISASEDLALMRTIPGMVVMNPSDDVEAKAAVKAALGS